MRQVVQFGLNFQRLLLASLCLCLCPFAVQAQPFPSRPVKLVVTYPPGGSSDLMARIMGQKLSAAWGQPVVIESKPGAAGSIGMEFAARQQIGGQPGTRADPGQGFTIHHQRRIVHHPVGLRSLRRHGCRAAVGPELQAHALSSIHKIGRASCRERV